MMWGFQWWMPMLGMGMMLFMFTIVGLIVWGAIRLGNRRPDNPNTGETPMDVLQMRLARGEITTEQFQELQDTLLGRG